jgi:tetratricopeptide (TPR) repeat protein
MNLYMALAVVLPTQGRVGDAIKLLRQAFKSEAANELAGVATMAWLLWRSGKDEASQWIQKGMDLASTAADGRMAEVRAFLMDLAGDWKGAQDAYLMLNKGVGAALTAIRMGDQCMEQGDHLNALNFYRQADQLWRGEAQQSGLALALYRQAEVYWQIQDVKTARSLLEQALVALPAGASSLQAGGRTAIQRALKMSARSKSKRWPVWRWQTYDDEFRISILFQV